MKAFRAFQFYFPFKPSPLIDPASKKFWCPWLKLDVPTECISSNDFWWGAIKTHPLPPFFFVSWASSQELDLNLHLEGTSTRDDKLRKFLDCSIFQEAMAWMWELHSITNWCVSSIYSRCFKGTLNGHSDSWYWPVISPGIHAVPKISSSYHTHVEWYVEVWHGKQPLEWFFLQASKNKIITDLMRKLRIWWLKPESKVRQKQNGEWGCTW